MPGPPLTAYPHRDTFSTRWNDNDQYGHVNNVVYYEAMDTTINRWLITVAGADPGGEDVAVCAASGCTFHRSLSYPEPVTVGLRADRLGTTSITWGLGLFGADLEQPAATGTFTHVFVDAGTRRPVPLPARLRARVEADLQRPG